MNKNETAEHQTQRGIQKKFIPTAAYQFREEWGRLFGMSMKGMKILLRNYSVKKDVLLATMCNLEHALNA